MEGKGRRKEKWILFCLVGTIIVFLVSVGIGFYEKEYLGRPLIKERLSARDMGDIYRFYVSATPGIDNRPFFGDKEAEISMIAYLDYHSESTRYFFKEVFPVLRKDYIDSGMMNYYQKYYLTAQDLLEKSDNFIYSATLHCVGKLNGDFYSFFFDMVETGSVQELNQLIEKYNISEQDLIECIHEADFDDLWEDASEIENYGIVGMTPRFYIGFKGTDNTIIEGIPRYQRFVDAIRELQMILGE
ncbi:thioredoxin domain-containing protein [Candidatus Woesearchaeota archaeon]|nr:thioredoxin domain-containing protein [Candidatus Woesearchaeota archaeon]